MERVAISPPPSGNSKEICNLGLLTCFVINQFSKLLRVWDLSLEFSESISLTAVLRSVTSFANGSSLSAKFMFSKLGEHCDFTAWSARNLLPAKTNNVPYPETILKDLNETYRRLERVAAINRHLREHRSAKMEGRKSTRQLEQTTNKSATHL